MTCDQNMNWCFFAEKSRIRSQFIYENKPSLNGKLVNELFLSRNNKGKVMVQMITNLDLTNNI